MAGPQIVHRAPAPRPRRKERQPLYRDWRIWIAAAVSIFVFMAIADGIVVTRSENGSDASPESQTFESHREKAVWIPYSALLSGYDVLKGSTLVYRVRVSQVIQIGREQTLQAVVSSTKDSGFIATEDQIILSCGTGTKCATVTEGGVYEVVGVLGTAYPFQTTDGGRGALPFMRVTALQAAQ